MEARVETYGNFTTMGVVADCPEGYTPKQIRRIKAFLVADGERRRVHDFVQVASAVEPKDYYANSLFWLEPGTEYAVEIEYYGARGRLIETSRVSGRTRPEPSIPGTVRALYVSPGGSDDNAGTLAQPLRTLKAAFAALLPGTTLFVREGTYYEGELAAPKGGSKEAPIVVRAYEGERVALDAAEPAIVSEGWTQEGEGIYAAPLAEMSWSVSVEDRETGRYYRCYPLRTREELVGGESAGMTFEQLGFTGAYYYDGSLLHLRLPHGRIEDFLVHAGRFSHGIVAEGCDYLFVDGLEFRHISGNALLLTDASENVVQNCRVLYCNEGVHVKGDSSNNTVQDSLFLDDVNHWHFEYAKTEMGWLYHDHIETGAVAVDGRYSGRGLVVRRNRIEGLFDGVHLCPWIEINARTSETDFCDNEVVDIADDFIETDGYSPNVRIFGNRMSGSLSGISLAQALEGPTWVIYNVIADWGVCSATRLGGDWGYPIKLNGGDGYLDVGTGTVLLYHNTSYSSDPDSRAFLVKHAMWRNMRFRNNIWCGKAMGLRTFLHQIWPVDWDYDVIFRESGPFAMMGDVVYESLSELQQARAIVPMPRHGPAGFGEHLQSADPEFADAEGGDYRLKPGSPCIDAGEVIPGINDQRFGGQAPDMGAFESEGDSGSGR